MKIVVTGASGNLGTALLRATVRENWEVAGIARRRPPSAQEPYDRARWLGCDIGAPGAVAVLAEAFSGADAVVHLAWAIHPRRTDPPMTRTNTAGTAQVLRAAAAAGVPHIVCASSVAAYTPAGRRRRVDEQWPRAGVPGSAYSQGKAVLEAQLDAFELRQPALRIARIRPCAIVQDAAAAEFGDWLFGPWLPRPVIGRSWVPVPLWKKLRMQFVHADDVAAAIVSVLRRRAAGAFNLAAEPVLPARALAPIFGGFRLPVSRAVLAAGCAMSWRLGLQPLHPAWLALADRACLVDSAKAARDLDWMPRHDATAVAGELATMLAAGRTGLSAPLAPERVRHRLGHPTHQRQRPTRADALPAATTLDL